MVGFRVYGEEGLVSATGIAETVLNLAYSDDAVSLEEGSRQLAVTKKNKLKTTTVSSLESALVNLEPGGS